MGSLTSSKRTRNRANPSTKPRVGDLLQSEYGFVVKVTSVTPRTMSVLCVVDTDLKHRGTCFWKKGNYMTAVSRPFSGWENIGNGWNIFYEAIEVQ